jgi:hypothetical protein
MRKKCQAILVVAVFIVSGCMNQQGPEKSEERPSPQYYTLCVTPSLQDHTMSVEAEITLHIPEHCSEVTFCLNPEFSVSQVVDEQGAPLPFEREYDLVKVDISSLSGSTQKVALQYDGMVYRRVAEHTWDYVGEEGCWVRSDYNWYPVIPGAAEAGCHFWLWWHQDYWTKATVSVEIPESWMVISSGALISEELHGSTKVCTWQEDQPLLGLDFVAGEYDVTADSWNGKEITCCLTEHKEKAQEYISLSKEILTFFSEKFGEYPFDTFSIVELPGEYGYAQGKPSFTLMDSALLDAGEKDIVQALSEAIAYQWWGNTVAGYDLPSIVVLEAGFPHYAWLLFLREKYGEDEFCQVLNDYQKQVEEAFAAYGALPVTDDFVFIRGRSEEVREAVVIKTYLMIHALKEEVGEEAFFEALRAFISAHRGESVTMEYFKEEFEQLSGKDLGTFFEQYYYGTDIPDVACT